MELTCYQINAFTNRIFCGNPACVVPLNEWLPNDMLLKIAQENAVAETAFFIYGCGSIPLRWFTPEIEMDLCGHATLATAHVLKQILNYKSDEILFDTLSGEIKVVSDKNYYTLDLPARDPVNAAIPENLKKSISIQPQEVLKSRDIVLVFERESEIADIKIDRSLFDTLKLDPGGVIVTAKGDHCDFVSRFFTPQASIFEDPVTGSAHCSLIPYWSKKLNKQKMFAKQISERGGELYCENKSGRVLVSGNAVTYSIGSL